VGYELRGGAEMNYEGGVLTCVYCGHEYPQDTPADGSQVLTDHIKVCEKHPMRKAEHDITLLRNALIGLVGVDGRHDLIMLEHGIRLIRGSEESQAVTIAAIHALLATLPEEQK
jgi:uncharacterized protein